MKRIALISLGICLLCCFAGCSAGQREEQQLPTEQDGEMQAAEGPYTVDTEIADVINDPIFGDYGRLIFPVDDWYYNGDTLGDLRLTWYHNIDPNKTVEIANYLKNHAEAGETVFYDIYTEAEKAAAET